jgi:hypothetical protein
MPSKEPIHKFTLNFADLPTLQAALVEIDSLR